MTYQRGTIAEYALTFEGTTEDPPFSNRIEFNDWYYPDKSTYHTTWGTPKYNSKAWPYCATAVSFWYFKGYRLYFFLPEVDRPEGFCSVPNLRKYAKEHDLFTDKPLIDDIVIFDFKPFGSWDHTGLFLEWEEEGVSFWCMEANTSATSKGSQDRGGGCFKRLRYVDKYGMKAEFINVIDNQHKL